MEKIKEKLPGSHGDQQTPHTTTTTTGSGDGTTGQHQQGLGSKIGEATGGHHGTGTGHTQPGHGTDRTGGYGEQHEKKGAMEKIQDKLPGSHNDQQTTHATTTTGSGYGDTHEKKGMMENIKEKLPGHQ